MRVCLKIRSCKSKTQDDSDSDSEKEKDCKFIYKQTFADFTITDLSLSKA